MTSLWIRRWYADDSGDGVFVPHSGVVWNDADSWLRTADIGYIFYFGLFWYGQYEFFSPPFFLEHIRLPTESECTSSSFPMSNYSCNKIIYPQKI